jgi:hypothetical protein
MSRFMLTDDDFYLITKTLAYYANNETASIGELSDVYDLIKRIERGTMDDEALEEEVRKYGEL